MKHFQHVEYNVKLSKWSQGKMKNGTGSFPKWQQFMKTFQESYLPGLSDSQRLGSKFVLLLQNIASSQYLLWCTHLTVSDISYHKVTEFQSSSGTLISDYREETRMLTLLLFISVAAAVTRAAERERCRRASLLYFVVIFCKSTLFWGSEGLFIYFF